MTHIDMTSFDDITKVDSENGYDRYEFLRLFQKEDNIEVRYVVVNPTITTYDGAHEFAKAHSDKNDIQIYGVYPDGNTELLGTYSKGIYSNK